MVPRKTHPEQCTSMNFNILISHESFPESSRRSSKGSQNKQETYEKNTEVWLNYSLHAPTFFASTLFFRAAVSPVFFPDKVRRIFSPIYPQNETWLRS